MAETLLDAADKEAAGGMGVSRRTSRRVSSMLARADLSAHHQESFSGAGVQGASQGRAGASFVGGGVGPAGLSTLREGPGAWASRSLLDDARGSDLEGTLQGMGLDDDGGLPLSGGGGFFGEDLAQEVLLTKIRSVPVENSNVRYSMSDTPARSQCRVFVLVAPPFAVSVGEDEDGTSSGDGRRKQQILVGIQDPVEKRLQLLTLYARPTAPRKGRGSRKGKPDAPSAGGQGIELSWGHLRKAQSVLDSCKLTDGDVSAILILSRTATADRSSSISELSVQAPWSQCTMVTVRQFPSQNLRSLDFRGSRVAKAKKNRESMEGFASNRKLVGLRHPLPGGLVSVVDEDGRTQQIRIQLEPRNPLVRRVLDACRSVLPPTHAERMLSGWWQVMQWTAAGGRLSSLLKDKEWSALTIELFVVFLALGLPDDFNWQEAHAAAVAAATQRPRTASSGSRGRDSWEGWDAMAVFEGASPAWAQSPAWQWTLPAVGTETERLPVFDTSPVADRSSISSGGSSGAKRLDFISRHVDYARQFALSELGIAAVGPSGYLPTACSRTKESRRDAARDLLMALHLLLEEAKLDVTSPEASRFGQAGLEDLRLVVCQIARWLRWDTFAAMYELSMLEERDSSHDDGRYYDMPCYS